MEADPSAQGLIAIMSIVSNICVISTIFKRWIERKRNPYTNSIFDDCEDYMEAYRRIGDGESEEILKDEPLSQLAVNN